MTVTPKKSVPSGITTVLTLVTGKTVEELRIAGDDRMMAEEYLRLYKDITRWTSSDNVIRLTPTIDELTKSIPLARPTFVRLLEKLRGRHRKLQSISET